MATREEEAQQWQDISRNSRKAAQRLLDLECYRSSVSRAYYAAYAAVTSELVARGLLFAQARSNPDHAGLPAYVLNNLGTLAQTTRFDINRAIRRLYALRIDADYVAEATLDRAMALSALHDLGRVFIGLGLENKRGRDGNKNSTA